MGPDPFRPTAARGRPTRTTIRVLSPVCCSALLTRFVATWRSRSASPITVTGSNVSDASSSAASCTNLVGTRTCASRTVSAATPSRSTGCRASGRSSSSRASRSRSLTSSRIRPTSLSMRPIASSSSGPGGVPPRRYSSANPCIDVNGVRSSCDASARNCRRRCSDAVRACTAASTRLSIALRAEPSRPGSVCGSTSVTRRARSSVSTISAAVCSIRVSGRRPMRTTLDAARPSINRSSPATALSIAIRLVDVL